MSIIILECSLGKLSQKYISDIISCRYSALTANGMQMTSEQAEVMVITCAEQKN